MASLDDGYLLDHAAGAGPRAMQVLTACQAALNEQAASIIQAAEAGFGGILASLPPAPLSEQALDLVLSRAEIPDLAPAPDAIDPQTGLPSALSPYLDPRRKNPATWPRRPGGMRECTLTALSGDDAEVNLVRLMPGGGIPRHDHGGEELTLVLTGAFHDGHALYGAGDMCRAEPGLQHRPAVQGDTPCICLTVSLGKWRPVNPLYGFIDRLTRPVRRHH
ncbi:MAG: ChrR family transcriptional regulator [Oceanicaulis sp. HLUCCA04]|nr:MAG: ChrR family transcriptional regulator [Oceanicaulis sp. HLUCCA04]